MIYPTLQQYTEFLGDIDDPVAASILVLADVIAHKSVINEASAEHMAHQLALMFRAVPVRVAAEVSGELSIQTES
jgi:hypothetical protein